ncbi:hypothetical protein N0B51_02030 [Tsuneonella sp. YG55]|uniref:Uncharacterized protein n=1 Tax=Tsuneonella litorea TaxID=2976475 RepID=A0A9X2VYQ8_9SPHN|nr:hypothetical protein [Tsuneonella litorea]MCT2557753.1 hypothetical protein [Tsuneonella litorea]
MPAAGTLRASPALWAGLAFAAFGADVALALTGAIGKPLALLLLIVPTALLYRAMRLAGGSAAGGACQPKGEVQRRYVRRVMAFTAAYLLAFALQALVAAQSHPPVPLRAALGLLPALAILGVFWAIGRLIVEETDEFMRMLVVRQVLVATALTLSAATVWGFLEAADAVPHVDAYWIAVVWFFGQFAGAVANRVTYGSWGAL